MINPFPVAERGNVFDVHLKLTVDCSQLISCPVEGLSLGLTQRRGDAGTRGIFLISD
jgi:hypothetical protein